MNAGPQGCKTNLCHGASVCIHTLKLALKLKCVACFALLLRLLSVCAMPFEFARKVERFKDRQGPGCTTDERAVTTAAAPVVVAAAAAQVEVDVDELDLQLQQVQLGESARVAGAEAAGSEQDQKQQRKPRTRKAEPAAKAPPVFPTPAAVPLPHGPYRVFTFDSETTTLVNAPSPCRFLDLAVVDVDTSACFDTLVDPQCYFRHKDAVHGITPGMVKGQPSAHVALKRMLEFVRARCNSGGGTTTVLVAHNGNRRVLPSGMALGNSVCLHCTAYRSSGCKPALLFAAAPVPFIIAGLTSPCCAPRASAVVWSCPATGCAWTPWSWRGSCLCGSVRAPSGKASCSASTASLGERLQWLVFGTLCAGTAVVVAAYPLCMRVWGSLHAWLSSAEYAVLSAR